MAHDGVLVSNSVRSQDIAGHAGALESHPHVIAFGHRDVLVLHLLLIFQAADLQHEQLRFRDLAYHPGQFFLYQLARGDGLVVELLAEQRILQGAIVARHSRANGSPGDAVAGLI